MQPHTGSDSTGLQGHQLCGKHREISRAGEAWRDGAIRRDGNDHRKDGERQGMGKIIGETGRDRERLEKWGQGGQQVIFSYFKYNEDIMSIRLFNNLCV